MRSIAKWNVTRKFLVIAIIQANFLTHAAYGQTINTFDNPAICESIQLAVRQLSPSSSASEWPRTLKFSWMHFPIWKQLDPRGSLPLIEENYDTEEDEYVDLQKKFPSPTLRINLLPTPQEIDSGWNRITKPRYANAIARNEFEFESTDLAGISGQHGKITVFRFRAVNPQRITIQIKFTPIYALYNWEYLVRIYDTTGSYKDYPITSVPTPIQGEMAIIEHSIVVFETTYPTNSRITEVYLPPAPRWWPSNGLAISDACILAFTK